MFSDRQGDTERVLKYALHRYKPHRWPILKLSMQFQRNDTLSGQHKTLAKFSV